MMEFWGALTDPSFSFLRQALLAGLLSAVAFGIMGTYVVARKITYLAGAIAHCVLGGIGAALYLRYRMNWAWLNPLYGAAISAVLAAVILGRITLPRRGGGAGQAGHREDTVIGALWAVGMAIGVVFLARTPTYADPMSYLFGNILLIGPQDLKLIAILDAVVVLVAGLFYHKLLAVCFDPVFAGLRGLRVEIYYLLLLILTALTIVLLVSVVGIIMVIALLTLPAATAGHFTNRLWKMMALASVFSMVFVTGGLAISYPRDLPAGATIILLAAAVYLLVTLMRHRRRPAAR